MAKTNRGRALWKTPARSRGTCPVCGHTRIKLLFTAIQSDGTKLKVCKRCQNADKARLDAAAV